MVDLGQNQLTRGIPIAFENLSSLNSLDLDQNNLTSSMPSQGIMLIPLTKNFTYFFFELTKYPILKGKKPTHVDDGLAKLNHFFSF